MKAFLAEIKSTVDGVGRVWIRQGAAAESVGSCPHVWTHTQRVAAAGQGSALPPQSLLDLQQRPEKQFLIWILCNFILFLKDFMLFI